jgi:hypothetical protein
MLLEIEATYLICAAFLHIVLRLGSWSASRLTWFEFLGDIPEEKSGSSYV